ncbi:tetratricopeptide repeat protein [Candidatus Parcubacteria bacterium]|nr:tetratricopeptide repeat protein [Candidatus Parcubacteria bacterium]
MKESLKVSFYGILLLIFLLPLFFIPTALVPLNLAKVALIAVVVLVSLGALIVVIFKEERFSIPKSRLLWGALAIPLIYIVSSVASPTPGLSLFGYGLELGTAGSMTLLALLFIITAVSFRDRARLVRGYTALFLSFALLALFGAVKIFSGGHWLTFGIFQGRLDNPIGVWTDLAAALGVLVTLSVLALEMLPMTALLRLVTWMAYALSLFLLAILGFSTMWAMLLGAGLVLLVYFLTVEKGIEAGKSRSRQGVWAAAILAFVALIFVWNPTFSTKSITAMVSEATSVSNVDVRPSLSTTLGVARSVFSKHPILGSGPQTFDRDWSLYRPSSVNSSPFWNTNFFFGFGFLPTAVSTTGLLGTLVWVLFLTLFVSLGLKILSKNVDSRADRFILMAAFFVSLFLWVCVFLFVPSIVLLALTFIFTGLTISAAETIGVIGIKEFDLNATRLSRFASTIGAIALVVLALGLGFIFAKRVLAIAHFERAVTYAANGSASVDMVENELVKAMTLAPSDQYWSALSQVELSRANGALQNTASTTEERQAVFQDSLSKAITALQNAISLNPVYVNWIAVGNLYESLVPAPLAINGAYENALAAYANAKAVNPSSPEVPLLLARLEFDHKDVDAARVHIDEALSLKQDYADAYFLLSQIEGSQNNLEQAVRSAETGVLLTPGNAGVLFELGLLKYSTKDYAGAADAMTRALSISPDYANAKYYLGLALDKLGKHAEAIAQFEDLAKTNPGNELVLQALANLRAGKDALFQAPSTGKTKTAPISGQ